MKSLMILMMLFNPLNTNFSDTNFQIVRQQQEMWRAYVRIGSTYQWKTIDARNYQEAFEYFSHMYGKSNIIQGPFKAN